MYALHTRCWFVLRYGCSVVIHAAAECILHLNPAMFTLKAFFKKLNSEPVRPTWKNILEPSQLLVLYAVGVLIATVSWLISPFNTDVPVEAFYALWSIGISVWTIAETLMSHARLPKVFLSNKAQSWYLNAVVGCQVFAVARLRSNIAYLRNFLYKISARIEISTAFSKLSMSSRITTPAKFHGALRSNQGYVDLYHACEISIRTKKFY